MPTLPSAVRTAALAASAAVVLVGLRPDFTRLGGEIAAPRQWAARIGVDALLGDLGAATLWLLAAWVLLALVTASATLLPGAAGPMAGRLARRMLPSVIRRVVIGSTGLGVLLAPVAAGATTQPAVIRTNQTPVSARVAQAAVDRVADSTPVPRWPQWPNTQRPTTQRPTTQRPTTPRPTTPRPTTPRRTPHPLLPKQAPNPDHHRAADRAAADSVTVHRGDSLWVIARRRLGDAGRSITPQAIAEAWPRWYAANHSVIGDDPGHITPGQVLHAPSAGDMNAP